MVGGRKVADGVRSCGGRFALCVSRFTSWTKAPRDWPLQVASLSSLRRMSEMTRCGRGGLDSESDPAPIARRARHHFRHAQVTSCPRDTMLRFTPRSVQGRTIRTRVSSLEHPRPATTTWDHTHAPRLPRTFSSLSHSPEPIASTPRIVDGSFPR